MVHFCTEINTVSCVDPYNSQTGALLWQTKSEFGVNAPPITYTINGVQYIAVASGGNSIFGFKQGDAVLVYQLKK